ncbi:MAG: hypothetical protein O7F12_13135 [Nitrospirae bacterium]|nr:hypothetical protein [Nitrospirota bacterium]
MFDEKLRRSLKKIMTKHSWKWDANTKHQMKKKDGDHDDVRFGLGVYDIAKSSRCVGLQSIEMMLKIPLSEFEKDTQY